MQGRWCSQTHHVGCQHTVQFHLVRVLQLEHHRVHHPPGGSQSKGIQHRVDIILHHETVCTQGKWTHGQHGSFGQQASRFPHQLGAESGGRCGKRRVVQRHWCLHHLRADRDLWAHFVCPFSSLVVQRQPKLTEV